MDDRRRNRNAMEDTVPSELMTAFQDTAGEAKAQRLAKGIGGRVHDGHPLVEECGIARSDEDQNHCEACASCKVVPETHMMT